MTNKVKKYWKQFGDWVISSKRNFFLSSYIKTVSIYLLSVFALLLIFHLSLAVLRTGQLREDISDDLPDVLENTVIFEASKGLSELSFEVLIIVMGISFILGYFFMNYAFGPVKDVIKSQHRFISDAAHELKTPLSILKTSTQIALSRKDSLKTSDAIEALETNLIEINRITRIINGLLAIQHLHDPLETDIFSKVDLLEVIDQAVKDSKPLADSKNVGIIVAKNHPAYLWGNESSIALLLNNILNNAISYTNSGGMIEINIVKPSPRKVELSIKDNGIGISENDLKHIFEPFFRVRMKRSVSAHYPDQEVKVLKQPHSGIGLAVVRSIVDQHKGKIEVKSILGKGTNFIIRLPAII